MAKDLYHQLVKEALVKDGWTITHDPYLISRWNKKAYEVDLGAEKFIAAQKGTEEIAVEIKSFLNSSVTYDFHAAFGQYNVYKFFMNQQDGNRKLYLAIPEEIYLSFFLELDIEAICAHFNVELLVFDVVNMEILKWIKR